MLISWPGHVVTTSSHFEKFGKTILKCWSHQELSNTLLLCICMSFAWLLCVSPNLTHNSNTFISCNTKYLLRVDFASKRTNTSKNENAVALIVIRREGRGWVRKSKQIFSHNKVYPRPSFSLRPLSCSIPSQSSPYIHPFISSKISPTFAHFRSVWESGLSVPSLSNLCPCYVPSLSSPTKTLPGTVWCQSSRAIKLLHYGRNMDYRIAPNFHGTIFSWISWLTSRSRIFYGMFPECLIPKCLIPKCLIPKCLMRC